MAAWRDSSLGWRMSSEVLDGAGDDVDGSGMGGDAADRSDQLGVVGGVALDFDDPLRGGGEGVAAQRHGRGAGVVGLAREGELEARLANDGLDHGERGVTFFEHRTLLDVDLERGEGIGRERAGDGDAVGVEAEGSAVGEVTDGIGDGDALRVGAGEMLRRELADGGQRGEEREAEAHAFLFGEGNELDVEGQAAWRRAARWRRGASRTPRGPSKAPALVTVSMWEKRTKVGASACAEGRMARRLPASSVRAVRPAWRIHHARRVWASRVAGERKRRVVSPGTSVMRASSRQRAMMVAARGRGCGERGW